ncbi:MAG: hypothetical protein AAF065_15030 [Verrucomicrobiota bacterium]
MKQRHLITTVAVVLLSVVCFVYFARTQEIKYENGNVELLSIQDSSIVIKLRGERFEPIIIESDFGHYTIPRNASLSKLVISEKGIFWESGEPCVEWRNSIAFGPASNFNKLNNKHFLGTIETDQRTMKLYYAQDKS